MKKVLVKILAIIMLFNLLLTSSNVLAITEYIEDEVINLGVVLELTSEKESVNSGELHKVRIKNSYANPNDEDYAICRVYLTDAQGKPNTVAELQGLVENKIVYTCENNEDLSVTVQLKEDKEENNVTAKYLEYILPPGTSVEMELQFLVPNGISEKEETLILTPEIKHRKINDETAKEEIHENDKMTQNMKLKWTSEFKWQNLQKTASTETIGINDNNKLAKDITYNFTADNNSAQTFGNIWTRAITISDTLTLPQGLTLPENITYSDPKNKIYSNNKLLYSINLPEEISVADYKVNEIKAENNQIKFSITINNPNYEDGTLTSDFNPLNNFSTTLYSENINAKKDYVFTGEEKIQNTVNGLFVPCSDSVNSITLNATKEITMEKDTEKITLTKTVDEDEAYKGDVINYTITIQNTGRVPVNEEMVDTMPEGTTLTDGTIQELKGKGYEISDSAPYTIKKMIALGAGEEQTLTYPATITTDKQKTITNKVTYGNLQKSASTNLNKDILKLEKKQIRKWINYQEYNYNREIRSEQNYPLFNLLEEGDRIEYEVTLTNNSNEDKQITLIDKLPTLILSSGYSSNLLKVYLAGYENQEFPNSNNNKGFIGHISNYQNQNNYRIVIDINIPKKTTLKQTFIMDVPSGEDYSRMLDAFRYNFGFYPKASNVLDANEEIYNDIYIQENNIHSRVYHTVEPRYYMQKGVLARNSIDNFEAGIASTETVDNREMEHDLNKYRYSSDEVITFYTYFVNDSLYNLDLSKTQIVDYLSGGLQFLGLNTIEDRYINGTAGFIEGSNKRLLSSIQNKITTKANSMPLLFVNDARGNTPLSSTNATYPLNGQGCEKDLITVECLNTNSKEIHISAKGTLEPGKGFYILYSCRVKPEEINNKTPIRNAIIWDLINTNTNYYGATNHEIRKSNSITIKSYYNKTSKLTNDGECNTRSVYQDSKGIPIPNGSSFGILWSGVQLEPEDTEGKPETRYGNVFIKKVDEAGNEITLNNGSNMTFQILNKEKKVINFTEKIINDYNYREKYAGKYYWYEESASDDTVTQLTTNARLSIKNLPEGTYYVQEIKAPDNFELTDKLVEFSIKKNYDTGESDSMYDSDFRPIYGLGKEIDFTNKYAGNKSVYIEKIDSVTKQLITNAETKFSVYDNSSKNAEPLNFVMLNTKDEKGNHYRLATEGDANKTTELITYQGKIQLDDLNLNKKYYIKEIEAPFGYEKNDSTKNFTLSGDLTTSMDISQIVKVENTKNINDVTISKVDSEETLITTDTAQFQLYDSEGNVVKLKKSNDEENNSSYEYTNNSEQEGLVDKIETFKGKIVIHNLLLGKYKLKEIKAPQGYIVSEEETELNIESSQDNYEYKIKNGKGTGNVKVIKTDKAGQLIENNNVVFQLYDESNQLIKLAYNDEKTDDGRNYYISEENTQNVYSQITTYKGKINIQNLPIGNYYLKEIVAPSGYSLNQEKIQFVVEPLNYEKPVTVEVQDAEYEFGQEKHVSTSYQKIEEKDNKDNFGFGYNGKNTDYENGNYNYIVVDGKEDIITYTLRVSNVSKKNYEKLVLINKLPDIGDTGAVNGTEQRDSEFTVKLAEKPNFELVVYNIDGEETVLKLGQDYTIEFSDAIQFTNKDWEGESSSKWYSTPTESTNSFRLKFNNEFELYSGYSISLKFDGNIQNNAKPGQIAWNSFGYRYYANGISLTPEPPKVGVKIPYEPIITKTMVDNDEGTFDFDIYEQGKEEKIATIQVEAGTSSTIPAKRTINGETSGYLEDGKTYIIKEQDNEIASLSSVVGERGEVIDSTFKFTYDKEQQTKVEFINEMNSGKVIVHHYIENTTNKVPAKGGGVVQDETIEDKIRREYTTQESDKVSPNYEYVSRTDNYKGQIEKDPKEVTYYYKLVDAQISEPTITKTATEKITKENEAINYQVSYIANIDKYIGNAKVTIVDHLPYSIDQSKSELANGTYDSKANTITWTEEISGIDTYTNGPRDILVNKTIKIVYKNQDVTKNIVNTVEGTVVLPVTNQQKTTESQAETKQEYKVDVRVNKVWKDNEIQAQRRPDKIKIQLLADGQVVREQELATSENTSYSFENLDKYDAKGKQIIYTVQEKEIKKGDLYFYVNSINDTDMLNQTITNTFKRPEDVIEIEVSKIWDDANNQYGRRPHSVRLLLKDEKGNVQKSEVTEDNEWKHKFTNLYKYDEDGKEKVYVVDEEEVSEKDLYFYTKQINNEQYTITNTFTVPEDQIEVAVNKVWEDNTNKYQKRPKSIKITLYGDGKETQSTIVGQEEKWAYTFKNLRKYDAITGKEINYTIKESEVGEGDLFFYETKIDNKDMLNQTITNTFTVPDIKIEVMAKKIWEDKNNLYERRPESIELVLYAEGANNPTEDSNIKEVEKKIVTEKENWSYNFENLPKYNSVTGDEIKYTIGENEVNKGDLYFYTKEIDNQNYTITNTFTVPDDRIKVEVIKEWKEDQDNKYEKRPDGIVAILYGDQEEIEKYTITKEEEWKHTFTNLRKYNEITGKEIKYTIAEQDVQPDDLLYYDSKINEEDMLKQKIVNTFKVTDVKTQSKIDKEGTEKITKKDEELYYNIKYDGQIDGYIGNAKVTITDNLPYEIDESKSNLAGGKYDSKDKKITWEEEIKDINNFKDGAKQISIQKQIKVVYKNIDPSKKTLINKVEGKLFLDTTKEENKVEAEKETQVDLKFNLKAEKEIIQISKNGKKQNVTNSKLQKVSVNKKQTNKTNIKIKYAIKVTNTGTLIGGGIVEENLPGNMKFVAKESDSRWYVENGKVKAKTGNLQPGEEQILNIVTQWTGENGTFGTLQNTVTITNTENEAGFKEETTQDNTDKADVIIEISTGGETYTIVLSGIMLVLLVMAIRAYIIINKKQKNNK